MNISGSDVVRITRHQPAERITWDAATPLSLVAVLMELNLLLDLMEKVHSSSIFKNNYI